MFIGFPQQPICIKKTFHYVANCLYLHDSYITKFGIHELWFCWAGSLTVYEPAMKICSMDFIKLSHVA